MQIRSKPFFETIVALCIILDCESVWKWMHGSGYFKLALVTCFILSLIVLNTKEGKIEIFRHEAKWFGLLLVYLLIFVVYNMVVNFLHLADTVQIAAIVLLMLLYFKDRGNLESVMDRISTVLSVLACVSLFFWMFGSILQILSPAQDLTIYVSNAPIVRNSYFYLHYEIQREELLGGTIFRNTGIFYEGPKYALFLATMLSYELFIAEKPKYKRCIVFTITALSTFAVTGIYAIVLIWIMFLFVRFSGKTVRGLVFRVVVVIGLFLMGIQFIPYFEDMFTMKASTASFSTRMDNYQAGFAAWKEELFMGAGYLNMNNVIAHYSSFRLNDIGYSNSVFRVLAQGGLYLATIYLIPMMKALRSGVKKRDGRILALLLVYLYFFITTSFPYNYINHMFLLIMCFGISQYQKTSCATKIDSD